MMKKIRDKIAYFDQTYKPYMLRKFERARQRWNGKFSPEPLNSLWIEEATIDAQGVIPNRVEKTFVDMSVNHVVHKWMRDLWRKLTSHKYHTNSRTGSWYIVEINSKAFIRKRYNAHKMLPYLEFFERHHDAWFRPTLDMLEHFRKKTQLNLDRIDSDPELVVGSKPPDTGTGWKYPIDTRGNAREHVDVLLEKRDAIDEHCKDEITAVRGWPQDGAVIKGPLDYRGITGGGRSAGKLKHLGMTTARIVGRCRDISNNPASVAHNPALNDKRWRKDLWTHYGGKNQIMPWNQEALLEIKSTPPVTNKFARAERAVLSIDFGLAPETSRWDGQVMQVPSSQPWKFGADQVALHGIYLETVDGDILSYYLSGAPWTGALYITMVGRVIDSIINKDGLKVKYYQIGDDMHFIGPIDHLKELYAQIRHFGRCKGMSQWENFILGEFSVYSKPDYMEAIQDPRVLSTQSSAVKSDYLPDQVEARTVFPRDYLNPARHKTAIEETRDAFELYPELVYWEGSPDDYRQEIGAIYGEAKQEWAKHGISEWIKHVISPAIGGIDEEGTGEFTAY